MKSLTLNHVGERGFLARLLPKLGKNSAKFLVPPGDDAAVLNNSGRSVLTIDGLTEGTHFRISWKTVCEKQLGLSFPRALGWKLMGSSLSDLASMGHTKGRWALLYLGATGKTDLKFLTELYRGVKDSANRAGCQIAGGDTVRASNLTLVAAIGAELASSQARTRMGARVGDLVCVAGTVGDASIGLQVLEGQLKSMSPALRKYFVRRFFQVTPLFSEGKILGETRGVHSCMDLSDSLPECLELLCEASSCGVVIDVDQIPMSSYGRQVYRNAKELPETGEDYALLFSATPAAVENLKRRMSVAVIGEVVFRKRRVQFIQSGKKLGSQSGYRHFG